MVKTTIAQESKTKLFNMLFLLFPKFKLIKIRDKDNMIILRKRNIFSKSIKVSILDMLLYYIPNEISIARWGNYAYTSFTSSKIIDILNNDKIYSTNKKLEACINYLQLEFISTKIINIYNNVNEVIIPLENGHLRYERSINKEEVISNNIEHIEDVKILKGNSFSFYKKIPVSVHEISSKFRYIAASLVLSILLNYNILVNSLQMKASIAKLLSLTPCITEHQDWTWIIIKNTS